MPQKPHVVDLTYTRTARLKYLLHLPADYAPDSGRTWPLILFLHGSGERGDDVERIRHHALPKKLETWPECPFIVVSPQCPADLRWALILESLDALLDHALATYAADPARVYLTGLSMGGEGAWFLAALRPDRFAALAPICARSSPSVAGRLKAMPTWVFHGLRDDIVPLYESERMVAALKALGNNARLTVYPNAAHNSWTPAYDEAELYDWFLSHQK